MGFFTGSASSISSLGIKVPSTVKTIASAADEILGLGAQSGTSTDSKPIFAWLGDVPLSRTCYPSSLSDSIEASYAEHALIGTKPTLQATGVGLIEQEWQTSLSWMLCNVDDELDKLRTLLNNQQAVALVYADGRPGGDVVLTKLSIDIVQTIDGKTLAADLSMTLKEYIDPDPQATQAAADKTSAKAVTDGKSTPLSTKIADTQTPQATAKIKKISTTSATRPANAITRS